MKRLFGTAYLLYHAAFQARYPFRPRKAILRDQSRRVRRIVHYAYRHVPFYREAMDRLGLHPADFKTVEDLAKLPIVEKEDYQRAPERFRSQSFRPEECLRYHTSGTTGVPVAVLHDPWSALQTAAHTERYRAVLKAVLGRRRYRETLIIPPTSSYKKLLDFYLEKTCFIDKLTPRKQILDLLDPPEKNIPLIHEFKPDIIHSYGSYIEELFARLCAEKGRWHTPKVAGFGADGLSDKARRRIFDHFGLQAFSAYSTVEAPRIGFECEEHCGLHINEDLSPVRIVDVEGRALPPGERGEVLVSNLLNRATVLLNYRLGDIAAFQERPCRCGRTLPLLTYPEGRHEDWIILSSGQTIHPQAIETVFKGEEDIWQHQFVQESLEVFRIRLVVKEGCNREGIASRLTAKLQEKFGKAIQVDVQFVDAIPRTPGGKVKAVISLCKPGDKGQ